MSIKCCLTPFVCWSYTCTSNFILCPVKMWLSKVLCLHWHVSSLYWWCLLLSLCDVCPALLNSLSWPYTRPISLILCQILVSKAIVFLVFAVACIFVVLVVFGVKKEDRQWIPRPDMNYLSWSYGLCCLSGWASLFAAIALYKGSREADDEFGQPYSYPKPAR